MSNQQAAHLIAQALPALVHPGDGKNGPVAIPLPMFRTSGIPADQAAMFAEDAGLPHSNITQLVAEALVHTLEQGGQPPTPETAIKQLEAAAATREHLRNRDVPIYCQCGAELFTVTINDFDSEHPTVQPRSIAAITAINPSCAVGHHHEATETISREQEVGKNGGQGGAG